MLDKNTLNQVVSRSFDSLLKTIENMVNKELTYQRRQLIFKAIEELQDRGVMQDTLKSELQYLGVRQISKEEFAWLYKMVVIELARHYGFKTPQDSTPTVTPQPSLGSSPFSIGASDEYVLPIDIGVDGATVSRYEVDSSGKKYLVELAKLKKASNKVSVIAPCPTNYEKEARLTEDGRFIETSCRKKRGF
jgi:hypothetical protein